MSNTRNFKIFNLNKETKPVFDYFNKSNMKSVEFLTLALLEALKLNIEKKQKIDVHNDYETIQGRVDKTLHSLLKLKAEKLNRNMDELIILGAKELINQEKQK